MEDTPLLKPPKSECPDIWIRPQYKWPVTWQNIEEPVVPLQRDLYDTRRQNSSGTPMASQKLRLPCQKGVAWSWWPSFRAGQLRQSCQIRLLRVGVWEQLYSFLFTERGGGSGRARALNCRRQAGVTTGNPKIDFHSYRVAGQPWARCVSQKPGMPPFGLLFWSEWTLFGRVRGSKFRCGSLIASPFLGLGLPFLVVQKTSNCEHAKIK